MGREILPLLAVETAPGELKLTVHLRGQRVHVGGRPAESPGEVISIAAKGSMSSYMRTTK